MLWMLLWARIEFHDLIREVMSAGDSAMICVAARLSTITI